MRRIAAGAALVAALALPSLAPAASFPLTVTPVDATTVLVSWPAQPGDGYRFSADGKVVSRTFDPGRASARFSKASSYSVEVLHVTGGDIGVYPAPPAPSGNTIAVNGTITASDLNARLAAAPAGPVTVLPAAGQSSFTVTGDLTLSRKNVTIQHATLRDVLAFAAGSGFTIEDSNVHSFLIDGATDWKIQRDTVDFGGVSYGPHPPFDLNGGSIMFRAKRWEIRDSVFKRAYVTADPSQHTEAWYIGCGNSNGLIQGNRFDDNGTTGHLFFTWFDCSAGANDPRDICVKGNTFTRSHNPYHQIDMRAELSASLNIRIDPSNTTDGPAVSAVSSWVRAC